MSWRDEYEEDYYQEALMWGAMTSYSETQGRIARCGAGFLDVTVERLKGIQWSGIESFEEYRNTNSRIIGEEIAKFVEMSHQITELGIHEQAFYGEDGFDNRFALEAMSNQAVQKINVFSNYLYYDVPPEVSGEFRREIKLSTLTVEHPGRKLLSLEWTLSEETRKYGRKALAPTSLLHGTGLQAITDAIAYQRFWEAREECTQVLEALGLIGRHTDKGDFSYSLGRDIEEGKETADLAFVLTRASLARLIEIAHNPKIAALLRG